MCESRSALDDVVLTQVGRMDSLPEVVSCTRSLSCTHDVEAGRKYGLNIDLFGKGLEEFRKPD